MSAPSNACASTYLGQPGEAGASDEDEEADAVRLPIPLHAFDVVIADECHRGYTASEESKWREVLNHFDAVRIGLTATPAAHTKAFFEELVYNYSYQQAVADGYLVDYDPVTISSQVTMEGAFLKPGEEVGLVDKESGQLHFEFLEDERELPPGELDERWASPDRDRKVVAEVVGNLREQQAPRATCPRRWFLPTTMYRTSHTPTAWCSAFATSWASVTSVWTRSPARLIAHWRSSASSATARRYDNDFFALEERAVACSTVRYSSSRKLLFTRNIQ